MRNNSQITQDPGFSKNVTEIILKKKVTETLISK